MGWLLSKQIATFPKIYFNESVGPNSHTDLRKPLTFFFKRLLQKKNAKALIKSDRL